MLSDRSQRVHLCAVDVLHLLLELCEGALFSLSLIHKLLTKNAGARLELNADRVVVVVGVG